MSEAILHAESSMFRFIYLVLHWLGSWPYSTIPIMNREDSSEYLLLNAYHKSVKERPDSQLQIGKDAAQTSSTVRPPKPPHKSHSDVQLLKQAAHLAGFVISSGKHYACVVLRSWNYSWTAETCSFAFSLLTFTGLVTMLLVHQNRPIPEWPQIVSINSIVSLFALFMRTGVGLVLAEGTSKGYGFHQSVLPTYYL